MRRRLQLSRGEQSGYQDAKTPLAIVQPSRRHSGSARADATHRAASFMTVNDVNRTSGPRDLGFFFLFFFFALLHIKTSAIQKKKKASLHHHPRLKIKIQFRHS